MLYQFIFITITDSPNMLLIGFNKCNGYFSNILHILKCDSERPKTGLARWHVVKLPILNGGLGVRDSDF